MRRTANALPVEPDEVPVISNELLEANVASIRTDLTDLKAEFRAAIARIDRDIRAMAAKAESEIKSAVARIDEQFREVRQDIRELRAENKSLRDKGDANYASLNAKVDEMRMDMTEMRDSIAEIRALQKAFLWVLGGLGTLATLSITVAKALHWI